MNIFAKNLKELRERSDISRAEMADFLGITTAAYSFYETAKRQPSLDNLCKIAEKLGTSPDELLGYDPCKISWIASRLKPALIKTSFSVDRINDDGSITLSYMTDEPKIEYFTLSEETLRDILDKKEKLANQIRDNCLAELLEDILSTEFMLS